MFTSKLTNKYFLISLIVIFLALSSLYWITAKMLYTSVQEQIEYRDELIAQNIAKRIDFMVRKIISDVRTASAYITKETERDKQFYISEMERMVSYDPLYLFIDVFDQDGQEIMRVPAVTFDTPLDNDDIVERLAWSKTHFVTSLRNLPDGRETIAISYPALDEEENYYGGVTAYLNLNNLSEYLSELRIGEKGINAVIDKNGIIIGHSRLELLNSSLNEHILHEFLRKERYGLWTGHIFDQQMIVAYRPLPLGGMGLIVGEPVEQAFASSKEVLELLFKGFMIILITASALTLVGTSRVVKPILQLIRQAQEYKENKRDSFDLIETKDELYNLSLTMDLMAKELTEKERRLFYILESIPYGVITTDQHGIITTFNRAAEKLTLYQREEAIGAYIIDLPLKENKEEFISWKTIKDGKAFDEVETYIVDKLKNKHEVIMHSSLFHGEDEQLVGAILILRDVSEMKKLEQYLEQRERLASLGQLTAGIAHEIKNPLSIIQAAAEAMELELTDSQLETKVIQEFINDILDSADRMNHLLIDFLKLSKGDSDSFKESVDLILTINELLYLLRKTMSDQDIEVICQYEVEQAYINATKSKISQVFLNIFLNSIKAMEYGGVLTVQLRAKEDNWAIIISDTGKGIPASQIKWVFNPFFSTKREGTGLGLSIAHEIILNHQGKIEASSIEGEGTAMSILLPKLTRRD